MNKIDLIKKLLEEKRLPILDKDRDMMIQEYMKLKVQSIQAIASTMKS